MKKQQLFCIRLSCDIYLQLPAFLIPILMVSSSNVLNIDTINPRTLNHLSTLCQFVILQLDTEIKMITFRTVNQSLMTDDMILHYCFITHSKLQTLVLSCCHRQEERARRLKFSMANWKNRRPSFALLRKVIQGWSSFRWLLVPRRGRSKRKIGARALGTWRNRHPGSVLIPAQFLWFHSSSSALPTRFFRTKKNLFFINNQMW